MIIVGLDIGGTTTKSILVEGPDVRQAVQVSASEPLVSAAGGVGKIVREAGIELSDLDFVACTGGGARAIESSLLGIKAIKVNEIEAIGLGGLALSKMNEAVVASIGTGTAVVVARKKGEDAEVKHLGGTGVGGGTLSGLGRLLLNKNSVEGVIGMGDKGSVEEVDLTVKDIVGGSIGRLPEDATASNFGKVGDTITAEDVAAGLINMVGQVAATVAYLAAKQVHLEDRIVFVGNLPTTKEFSSILLKTVSTMGGRAVVPKMAAYAAALGAAIKVRRAER